VLVDPNLPLTIYGDEEAISKIVRNLLGNAFKFTSEGQVSLTLERREEQMAIQVSDTGIGIPPHAREFIFDEFRQVDQTSKRKYGGTGLGLAIVQKLARAMGGQVTLESELGKGSTFTVLIPIQTTTEYA
jgi:signal transduction histidine kinase